MEPERERIILNDTAYSNSNQYQNFSSKGNIKDKKIRWIGCLLCAIYICGSSFTYDNPSRMKFQLAEQLKVQPVRINLFYLINDCENWVVPVFSGYFAHISGLRTTIVIFSGFVLIGQVFMSIACAMRFYFIALLARFIFGLGMNAVYVIAIIMIAKWFRTKEIGLALSFIWIGYFAGSTLDVTITFNLKQEATIATRISNYATFMCLVSFIAGLIWVKIDKDHDQSGQVEQTEATNSNDDVKQGQLFTQTDTNLGDILNFDKKTWLSLITFLLVSTTYLGTYGLHGPLLYARARANLQYHITQFNVFTLIICISLPIFGKVYDTIGQTPKLIILGALGQILSAIWIYFSSACTSCLIGQLPYLASGIAYSLFLASFWPFVAKLEQSKYLGIVVGLIYNAYNLSSLLIILSERMGDFRSWSEARRIILTNIMYGVLGFVCSILISHLFTKRMKEQSKVTN